MALVTDKLVFLHIPKTGGMWVKNALSVLNIKFTEMGHQHEHFPSLLHYEDSEFFRNKFVFAFVRHPVYWYQSRWAFRVKHGWQATHPLDFKCASNDFCKFVDNVLRVAPYGWCSWLFDQYVANDYIDFIGRAEILADDFLLALVSAGYVIDPVDELAVRNLRLVNSSNMGDNPSSYWARYTPSLLERLLSIEDAVVSRYYHTWVIDPNALCGHFAY